MNIFLIGFMGSGKSRKGRELAAKLGWPLLDIDEEIVKQTGLSIPAIFTLHGEAYFRKKESETLRNYPYPENMVIAAGGGLPCYHQNMEWMNAHGITVYLEMSPKALVSRLGKREKRPLIAHMDDAHLLAFIEDKLLERSAFYEQASKTINGMDLSGEDLKNELGL